MEAAGQAQAAGQALAEGQAAHAEALRQRSCSIYGFNTGASRPHVPRASPPLCAAHVRASPHRGSDARLFRRSLSFSQRMRPISTFHLGTRRAIGGQTSLASSCGYRMRCVTATRGR